MVDVPCAIEPFGFTGVYRYCLKNDPKGQWGVARHGLGPYIQEIEFVGGKYTDPARYGEYVGLTEQAFIDKLKARYGQQLEWVKRVVWFWESMYGLTLGWNWTWGPDVYNVGEPSQPEGTWEDYFLPGSVVAESHKLWKAGTKIPCITYRDDTRWYFRVWNWPKNMNEKGEILV